MFGGGPSPDDSSNSTVLHDLIKKLNQTVQDAYKAALQNSLGRLPTILTLISFIVGSAITNAEQLETTINDLLNRANELTKELEQYILHKVS